MQILKASQGRVSKPIGPESNEANRYGPLEAESRLKNADTRFQLNLASRSSEACVCNRSRTMLVGHSRGGKLAVLASEGAAPMYHLNELSSFPFLGDKRVKSLFLMDPVDNTVYAPERERFPSALKSLRRRVIRMFPYLYSCLHFHSQLDDAAIPVAVIGAGRGSDCAPKKSNFEEFFTAAPGGRMEVVFPAAGHFEFLDSITVLERTICDAGRVPDSAVKEVTSTALALWADNTLGGPVKITNKQSAIKGSITQEKPPILAAGGVGVAILRAALSPSVSKLLADIAEKNRFLDEKSSELEKFLQKKNYNLKNFDVKKSIFGNAPTALLEIALVDAAGVFHRETV